MACNYPFFLIRNDPCWHIVPVPCCNCMACRKDKIVTWSDRIAFEASTSQVPSTFLTLTFDDAHMPKNRSANKKHMQDFFKRLRYYAEKRPNPLHFRYFYTSEYGDLHYRLHYHAIITNFDGGMTSTVEDVASAWADKLGNRLGIAQVGSLQPGGIRYVTEYMSFENPALTRVYKSIGLSPLVHGMSKGIGKDWILAHADMIKASNGYYSSGVLRPIPRYFADKLGMIEKNEYVKRLSDIWQKYNDILIARNIEPVDPFDVNALRKRHLLDQYSPDSKRSVLQSLVGQEGNELMLAHKFIQRTESSPRHNLEFNTLKIS